MDPFDIFEVDGAGSPLWRGTAETLDAAMALVCELTVQSPRNYFIWDHETGTRIDFKAGNLQFDGPPGGAYGKGA